MAPSTFEIAIIGAGLSGLCLALALHQQNLKCTVYEARPAPLNIGGAVTLSPNALKVLDAVGVYAKSKARGYSFEKLEFKDTDGTLLETHEFGSEERYGYQALRIYRYALIEELLAVLHERGIPIRFGCKYSHVVREADDAVVFALADGTEISASVVVGADGIHSTVRKHLYPDLHPSFTHMAAVTAAVPTAQLKLPEGYYIPVTVTSPQAAFVMAPQEPDGSEVLIGKQRRVETDLGRVGWEAALADKESCVAFLREGTEYFPEFVRNAVSHIPVDKINIWPFYLVPELPEWTSHNRRVVILGDAAHAIPPSAGQGINQALEGVYLFALLVAHARDRRVDMTDALGFWQEYRKARIAKVLELNAQIDLRRLPVSAETFAEKLPLDLAWLYGPDFKKDVEEWVAARGKGN